MAFFSTPPLARDRVRRAFGFMERATVIQDEMTALTVPVPGERARGEVKVSFFGEIGFGRVGEPVATSDGVWCVASLRDLLATTLKVLLQRVEAKDYQDSAALRATGWDLADGLSAAGTLFGPSFPVAESLHALTYFEGGDLASLSRQERSVLVAAADAVEELPHVDLRARALM